MTHLKPQNAAHCQQKKRQTAKINGKPNKNNTVRICLPIIRPKCQKAARSGFSRAPPPLSFPSQNAGSLMTESPNGRPPVYSDELANAVLIRIAMGESLNQICRHPDMPARTTVAKWRGMNVVDSNGVGFAVKYALAQEERAHFLADEIVEIADESPAGESAIDRNAFEQQRKARIDARKWYASKVLPKVYGDRITLDTPSSAPEQLTSEKLAQIAAKAGLIIDGEVYRPPISGPDAA
jgi:hypothetical protein